MWPGEILKHNYMQFDINKAFDHVKNTFSHGLIILIRVTQNILNKSLFTKSQVLSNWNGTKINRFSA